MDLLWSRNKQSHKKYRSGYRKSGLPFDEDDQYSPEIDHSPPVVFDSAQDMVIEHSPFVIEEVHSEKVLVDSFRQEEVYQPEPPQVPAPQTLKRRVMGKTVIVPRPLSQKEKVRQQLDELQQGYYRRWDRQQPKLGDQHGVQGQQIVKELQLKQEQILPQNLKPSQAEQQDDKREQKQRRERLQQKLNQMQKQQEQRRVRRKEEQLKQEQLTRLRKQIQQKRIGSGQGRRQQLQLRQYRPTASIKRSKQAHRSKDQQAQGAGRLYVQQTQSILNFSSAKQLYCPTLSNLKDSVPADFEFRARIQRRDIGMFSSEYRLNAVGCEYSLLATQTSRLKPQYIIRHQDSHIAYISGDVMCSDYRLLDLDQTVLANVGYESNFLGKPRSMTVAIPVDGGLAQLRSKMPTWNSRHEVWVLNFRGRPLIPSKKNFVLQCKGEHALSLRKQGQDTFELEAESPLSPLQAFAVAVTSLQKRIG